MPVANTASPNVSPAAPKDSPRKVRPSSRTNMASATRNPCQSCRLRAQPLAELVVLGKTGGGLGRAALEVQACRALEVRIRGELNQICPALVRRNHEQPRDGQG